MLFLSKFLPLLIYPLGLACFMIFLAIMLSSKQKVQKYLLLAAFLLLWLGGNRWVAYGLTRALEWQVLPAENIPAVEVAVVLGGGTDAAEYPRRIVEVNGAGDRVIYAAKLFQEKKIKQILLSGGNITWQAASSHTPAQDMGEILQMMGVPKENIWLETKSRNTYENARYSAQILKEKDVPRVLLITSASHMPRAMELFRREGVDVVPIPVDYTVTRASWEHLWEPSWETQMINLLPSVGNLSLTTRAIKEWIGGVYARLSFDS